MPEWKGNEHALQALWHAGGWPAAWLVTEAGDAVEVLDPGTWNRGGGPDFLGACLRIAGRVERGHVEIHDQEEDWHRHGHDRDPAYRDVLLHVIAGRMSGRSAACARHTLRMPGGMAVRAASATGRDRQRGPVPAPGACRSWIHAPGGRDRLAAELGVLGRARWSRRIERFHRAQAGGSGPLALLAATARSLGQPENGPALERWVSGIPIGALDLACVRPGPWRDPSLIEARLFSGASVGALLDREMADWFGAVGALAGRRAVAEPAWQAGGTRPQGSPWRRLAGLAALLAAAGGPSQLAEDVVHDAEAWISGVDPDLDALAARFERPGDGIWGRRARPGGTPWTWPAALIGGGAARVLVQDVVLPFALAAGAGGGAGTSSAGLDRLVALPALPANGVVRWVAARMGLDAEPAFSRAVAQAGAHAVHRLACAAGPAGCEGCPLALVGLQP